jgi:hypothetical protein
VAEVFQLIGQQRKTGVLVVSHDDRELEISFHEGFVLRAHPAQVEPDGALCAFLLRVGALSEAELNEARRERQETLEPLAQVLEREGALRKSELEAVAQLLTQDTLFELFFWEDGHFAFRAEAVERSDGDRTLSAENVLLDALRMRDEWAEIRPHLPVFAAVLAPSTDIIGFRERRALLERSSGLGSDALERLFRGVDRRASVRRIIDLSRLGTFQGARGLVAMLRGGVLQMQLARTRAEPVRRPAALDVGASLVAVAGIGAVALAAHAWVSPPQATTFPVPATALADARAGSDHERIAVLLEVYRWSHGGYPQSLAELRTTRWSLLASAELAGYSYERVGDGYRLEQVRH